MTSHFFAVLLLATAGFGTAAHEGKLGTLPHGRYVCELPGDAAGLASRPVDKAWFEITNASTYVAETGKGTYLLSGDDVVFTRGPMRGARFERVSPKRLQRTNLEGEFAKMRCVRTGSSR
ncbi:elongation factor P [Parafrankia sp. BMG5.11]|uniref:elongation factor P n=1 Tax=Parafrankia sp. BMG5.11 TaxID=222540 RepID=UPI001039ADF9|nr:elongation factor P [Parafrankia sp. BMG5.11]TCJ39325.1 elongation factor P [Parafrankia sp. BMG5.11]